MIIIYIYIYTYTHMLYYIYSYIYIYIYIYIIGDLAGVCGRGWGRGRGRRATVSYNVIVDSVVPWFKTCTVIALLSFQLVVVSSCQCKVSGLLRACGQSRTETLDSRGFEAVGFLVLKGWNSRVHGEFPRGLRDPQFVDS